MSPLLAQFLAAFLLIRFSLAQQQPSDLWDIYQKCKDTLGKPNWMCDPSKKIYHQTADEVNDLLWQLQTEIPCYCKFTNDCYRNGGSQIQSGVVGAMIVTDYLPEDIDRTARRIYDDATLATSDCENGLLIVYAMDGRQFYTFRGNLTESTLDSAKALEIMAQARKQLETNDYRYALPELLKRYISNLKGQTFDRQRTWEAMVGMVVAAVVCAFVAAIGLAIFVTSWCRKRKPYRYAADPSPKLTLKPKQIKAITAQTQRKKKLAVKGTDAMRKRLNENRKKFFSTKSGAKISPKKLMLAHQQMAQNRPQPLINEEPYYVISEPSTMYSTLPRDSPERMPYSRPYPITGGQLQRESPEDMRRSPYGFRPMSQQQPMVTYPDTNGSQAYLVSRSPVPAEHETQRRDLYLLDEEESIIKGESVIKGESDIKGGSVIKVEQHAPKM